MILPDYYTSAQAARRAGVSQPRIRRLCLDGRFPGAEHVGPIWLIPVREFDPWADSERKSGNPSFRKCLS
jgi:hypothetical protein